MMSDSDDTDLLLLLPPDLFLVPSSSESDASSNHGKAEYGSKRSGVISELVEHMQSLESRICAIESKDNSLDATLLNNSLDSQIQNNSITKFRQTLPRTRFHVSQSSSLQNTPAKPRRSLSVPTTPHGYSSLNHTNICSNDIKLGDYTAAIGADATNASYDKNTHDLRISRSDPSVVPPVSDTVGFAHATATFSKGEPYSCPGDCKDTSTICVKPSNQLHSMPSTSTLLSTIGRPRSCSKSSVQDMELSDVDELLQEMEATEQELSKRINRASVQQSLKENATLASNAEDSLKDKSYGDTRKESINRRLELESQNSSQYDILSRACQKKYSDVYPNISLPDNDSVYLSETDKMISEFKMWEQNGQNLLGKTGEIKDTGTNIVRNTNNVDNSIMKTSDAKRKESVAERAPLTGDANNIHRISVHSIPTYTSNVHKSLESSLFNELAQYSTATSAKSAPHLQEIYKSSQVNGNVEHTNGLHDTPFIKSIAHASTNTDFLPRKSQRLLSLSDFWDNSGHKSQEEMHRIRLEEEKFRREHCEHLIQELQKRLLEQQEKVAVALRVDNEKNELIAQFHNAWTKLKQRLHVLENEYNNLQTNLKDVTEKHQSEIAEFQSQIKRYEGELSKALDLAAGYKEKSDSVMKEKLELLKTHADELENYKSFVQEAESRHDQLKVEHNKLIEKSKQTEETVKSLQQELGKERLKGGEVRNEMNVIHKALDTCEAELIVLRQEKGSLQLKLKEEMNRNAILAQKNTAILSSLDDAKKAEKLAKDETKSLAEQKEKIRSELQDVYQKQVDEVVKVKLQEFQTQLDAAESEYLEDLRTRQQVIAECAARKVKDVMDKHRLEISLLEEKHKEEKRLCELQLAQALQKASMLETQLNSQRAAKSQLAEQLHSVMQKQWQQALQIISGGNPENLTPLQKIHAERLFELRGPKKSESMPNCYAKVCQEPIKLQMSDMKNFHDHNESRSTMTPIDETPLTSRKETKDDLRKYIRMIADMQQSRDEFAKMRESILSPTLVCREVPRKHYTKKELSTKDEDSSIWQPASETTQDTSEFIPISQKIPTKANQSNIKPPWK